MPSHTLKETIMENTYFRFKVSLNGNIFTVDSPRGCVDFDTARQCLNQYGSDVDILTWEKRDET